MNPSTPHPSPSELRALYLADPEQALATNHATTSGPHPADPFHTQVRPNKGGAPPWPVSVHSAVGGPYDAPCPGDLLCAALAACQDASIRMVARAMGIALTELQVQVHATFDARGALGVQAGVPVGYQHIRTEVRIKAQDGTPPELLKKLQTAAERCCVVSQTLKQPPTMEMAFHG